MKGARERAGGGSLLNTAVVCGVNDATGITVLQ